MLRHMRVEGVGNQCGIAPVPRNAAWQPQGFPRAAPWTLLYTTDTSCPVPPTHLGMHHGQVGLGIVLYLFSQEREALEL